MKSTFQRAWIIAIALLPVAANCRLIEDDFGPPDLSLIVGLRIDSATFRSAGQVILELIPINRAGETFVADSWDITVSLERPTDVLIGGDTNWVQLADPLPRAAAIHVDDSPSMRTNDAEGFRATAAQAFWTSFLGTNPANLAALTDYGWPRDSATLGFNSTRLLAGYTADRARLDGVVDSIRHSVNGSTRLYESALEVLQWTDTVIAPTYERVLIMLTDGQPITDDTIFRDQMFAAALDQNVRVFAVGIGPASDQGPSSNDSAVAVVRELAARTGGIYTGTSSASQLLPVLTALATVSTDDQLLVLLTLDPVPPPGAVLDGTVRISGQRGTASARWTGVAP